MRPFQPAFARLRRVLHTATLALATLALVACGGGGDDAATAPTTDDPAAVVRLQWAGAAPLFTASGQQHALQVQALDANGKLLNVPVGWQSSAPAVVSVAAPASGGTGQPATLTAQASTGHAVVTATVGSRSLTAVALVVSAAPGTVVLSDAQVSGEPVATPATLAAGRLKVGGTYTVTLQPGVAAPAVGSLVLGQGSQAIAGEVVAVNGQVLTLALVPLKRLLPNFQLQLDLPLQAGPPRTTASAAARKRALAAAGARTQAETEFSVAGFECTAEGSAGGVELAKNERQPLGLDTLRYQLDWSEQRQTLRLMGQPGVSFEFEPTAKLAFTGKVDCKLELGEVPIPIPPQVGLLLGAGFPIGVGFTLEGALPVNAVALNLKGQVQVDVLLGFDCKPECVSLNRITPTGSVTPTLTAPEFTANRLELAGQVYVWANFEGGARFSSTLQFDAIEGQAGLKFATTLASEHTQAKDATSATDYQLSFEATVAPTEALGDFAEQVGLVLDQLKFETSVPLGRSPTAGFQIDKRSFKALDDVNFQLNLATDEVNFPLLGYNVQGVRVYRKTTADDGSYVLTLVGEQAASPGQTQFTIPWLATVDSGPTVGFVAFVQTQLLSGQRWMLGVPLQTTAATAAAQVTQRFVEIETQSGFPVVKQREESQGLEAAPLVKSLRAGAGNGYGRASSTVDSVSALEGTLAGKIECARAEISDAGVQTYYRALVDITVERETTVTVDADLVVTPSGNYGVGAEVRVFSHADGSKLASLVSTGSGGNTGLSSQSAPPTPVLLPPGVYRLDMFLQRGFCQPGDGGSATISMNYRITP
jgi:hypothetical protein